VHEAVRALANLLALLVLVGNRPKPLDRRHIYSGPWSRRDSCGCRPRG
jgi:hypothetical protein